jgi:uracil-DNA glycosylase family 4
VISKPAACIGCPAYESGKGFVPGTGPSNATVALVGQGPGKAEAYTGKPFVGPSGSILERWLGACGKPRDLFWIDNVVRCWLPGNRAPTKAELVYCTRTHLFPALNQLPDLRTVATLGMPAARALIGDANEKIVGAPHPVERKLPTAAEEPQ